MLAAILSKVQKLTTDWTTTKSGYVDAAVSSRAPSSTALSTSVWTSGKAAFLDVATSSRASQTSLDTVDANVDAILADTSTYLDAAVSSAGLKVPAAITGYIKYERPGNTVMDQTADVTCGSSQNAWTSVLSASGSGVLQLLGVHTVTQNPTGTWNIRLQIDGVTKLTISDCFNSATDTNEGYCVVGVFNAHDVSPYVFTVAYDQIRFTSSFALQVQRSDAGGGSDFRGLARYYTV